jgi:hypothetical protein
LAIIKGQASTHTFLEDDKFDNKGKKIVLVIDANSGKVTTAAVYNPHRRNTPDPTQPSNGLIS